MEKSNAIIKKIGILTDDTVNELVKCNSKDYESITNKLREIIDIIDLNEFGEKKGIMEKFFNKNKEDKLYNKYNQVCLQVEKVAVELKVYQNQIIKLNQNLKKLLQSNLHYTIEIDEVIEENKNNEKLVHDLSLSKIIMTQNLPLLDNMIKVNDNLIIEINQSFLVTLPIVNQCLNNIINAKRKTMTNEALAYVDEKTETFLKEHNMEVSKETKKLVVEFGEDILLLEKTKKAITDAINRGRIL